MLVTLLAGAGAVTAACGQLEKKGGNTPGRGPLSPLVAGDHPFAPVRLVIHPLTRLVKDPATGEDRVEVYLELQDKWEDSVKWLGVVVFEAFRDAPAAMNGPGGNQQIKSWRVDLTDPDENSRPYDRVTRTYRLTLVGLPDLKAAGLNGSMRLSARFTTIEGRTLTATSRLE